MPFAKRHLSRFSRREFLKLLAGAGIASTLPRQAANAGPAHALPYTPEQLLGQVFGIDLYGSTLTADMQTHLQTILPGGFSLFRGNTQPLYYPAQVRALVQALKQASLAVNPLPLLVMVDQESQKVARMRGEGFTLPPNFTLWGRRFWELLQNFREHHTPTSREALWADFVYFLKLAESEPALQEYAQRFYEWGFAVGKEMRAVGVDATYAPVLDRAGSEILEERAISSDPLVISLIGTWYARGLQRAGVQCIGKHAPGLGGALTGNDDPHLGFVAVRLHEWDLFPFWVLNQQGLLAGIMPTHLRIDSLDLPNLPPDFAQAIVNDPAPATLSHPTLSFIRQAIGFAGPFLSDGLGMQGLQLYVREDSAKAVLLAVLAGMDMALFDPPLLDSVQLDAQARLREWCLPSLQSYPSLSSALRGAGLPTAERLALAGRILNLPEGANPSFSSAESAFLAWRFHQAAQRIQRLRRDW
ncbi:MAG TPA: glycoside hydrolase family 3 N-terminal domain-containing protein [Anaerolineales bacterium]|nr:glycoside hydrolase family 3 N-terminal domain-containing protein [Anaerolineales bacterium]